MSEYRSVRDLDWPMLVISFIICGFGVVQIFSATRHTIWHDAWWKQILFIFAGVILMWLATIVDYHTLLHHVHWMYIVAVVGLLVTLFIGREAFGSRRWTPVFGGFGLQVSEFVKLVIILLVARFLTDLKLDVLEARDMLKISGLVFIPMIVVVKQPDLGTALTYLPALIVGMFLAGLRWKYMLALVLVGVMVILVLVLPVGSHLLKDYQKARLISFMDPYRDPRGTGYQTIQSMIAVGAGGMWGKGVTKGLQTQLRFLPVPQTDFILSAFAEEHGFVGVVVVLALYFMLIMQIVQNAQTAPDRAGMYICMGVAAILLFHVLVNAGMVVGKMPVTGITLPLMSAGGSSILSNFLMLGLVNNVRLRRFVN
jgi:rod shape determining protein RodA